jgi:hypothetical protein
MHYGYDISSNNHPYGKKIDHVAACNHLRTLGGGSSPFAIVKISEATGYVNPYWQEDLAGARAAGADIAGYLFDHGGADPGAENALYTRVAGNLPKVDDAEAPDGLNPTQYAQHIEKTLALDPLEMVYLNLNELNTLPGAPWNHWLWLAYYHPELPPTHGIPVVMHQFTSSALIPGIPGYVDLNNWLGSEDQYAHFFHGAPYTPGTTPPSPSQGPQVLQMGAKGAAVQDLQILLNQHGAHLNVDADFGPATRDAVILYQHAHGLVTDGLAGPATMGSLHATPPTVVVPQPAPPVSPIPFPGMNIHRGAKGGVVATIQRIVGVVADGDFGPNTEQAVRNWQARNGLAADGVVGPITWHRMFG